MTIKERKEILKNVLASMPDTFSSDMFCLELRKFGVDNEFIAKGNCSLFLKRYVKQGKSRRSWVKKTAASFKNELPFDDIDKRISEAIELLKNNGFKIQRPVQRWEDI